MAVPELIQPYGTTYHSMDKLKIILSLITLLITSCSSSPLETIATPALSTSTTLPTGLTVTVKSSPSSENNCSTDAECEEFVHSPTGDMLETTSTPAKSELDSGKPQCVEKGHVTTWDLSDNWLNTYSGFEDDQPASFGMTLMYKVYSIDGVLFYTDKPGELEIHGCLEKDRDFSLNVYNENNERVAVVVGQFPEIDPLGGYSGGKLERDVITGSWKNELTGETQPIYLRLDHSVSGTFEHQYEVAGATDDKIVDQAAQDFLNAVASNDKESVAGMIEYPIGVTINGNEVVIRNQEDLIAHYQQIFTKAFKERLAQMIPKHMFAKWSGIMMGHGEIWLNAYGKIIAINNAGG